MSIDDFMIGEYIVSILSKVPWMMYVVLFTVFVMGVCLILFKSSQKKRLNNIFFLFILEYIVLLFLSTVLFRSTPQEGGMKLDPFWSYRYDGNNTGLLIENLMNVLAFVPIGVFLGFRKLSVLKAMACGMGVSVTIELLQFLLDRGLCELDDVIHNTLGCLIGYVLYCSGYYFKKINKVKYDK